MAISVENRHFSRRRAFNAPDEGVPLELVIGARSKKKLPGRERSLTISSAVWIQYTNVTDGQTDTGRQQRPRLRMASAVKIAHPECVHFAVITH